MHLQKGESTGTPNDPPTALVLKRGVSLRTSDLHRCTFSVESVFSFETNFYLIFWRGLSDALLDTVAVSLNGISWDSS